MILPTLNLGRIRAACLIAFVLTALFGCGGGGGGGGATGILFYVTDWTNRNSGNNVTGLSQRVQVYSQDNVLLKSLTMNQDATGLQQLDVTGIGAGARHLRVELFSGRDLQGVQTGELDVWLEIGPGTTFTTGVGDSITQVKVSPPAATIEVQHSKQFYATAYATTSKATFTPLDDFTWQTLGGVATVNQDGVVLATATGTGSVRATNDSTGLQGAATITVAPFQTTRSKWTVIVYLNAANDLATFAPLNVNQMEEVAGIPGNVRFVVQWKQSRNFDANSPFNGTRRYLVKQDNTSNIASELIQDMGDGTNTPPVDMGSPQTLSDFIQWAKTYYPADRYVLVMWNHGNGWLNRKRDAAPTRGVSYDDDLGTFIRTPQLPAALGNEPFDILAWDASLMQMIEVAYEIQDQARFIAGSEESPPGEGYPYDLIFSKFRDNPDDTTKNLAKAFVDGILAVPGYGSRKITQSVVDTSKLGALATTLDTLAGELLAASPPPADIQWIRANTQSYSDSAPMHRFFRDIYDLCLNIESRLAAYQSVVSAAVAVRTAFSDAVVWEGHNAHSPKSHGLSIDFSPGSDFMTYNALDYAGLRFGADTRWNEWLQVAP